MNRFLIQRFYLFLRGRTEYFPYCLGQFRGMQSVIRLCEMVTLEVWSPSHSVCFDSLWRLSRSVHLVLIHPGEEHAAWLCFLLLVSWFHEHLLSPLHPLTLSPSLLHLNCTSRLTNLSLHMVRSTVFGKNIPIVCFIPPNLAELNAFWMHREELMIGR